MKIYYHIGFHKTATTFFQNNIFSNNDGLNLLNDFKKPWNDRIIEYLIKTPTPNFNRNYYLNIIRSKYLPDKVNLISAERLSGHPGSGGIDSFDIADKIYLAYPTAKIIIHSRNYESFKRSCYSQLVKEGYCGKYADLDNKSWKIPGPSETYFKQIAIIEYYQKLFGKENVLIQKYEDFINNQQLFYGRLSKFLSIPSISVMNSNKVLNKSMSNAEIKILRVLNKFRKTEFNKYPFFSISDKSCFRLAKALAKIF